MSNANELNREKMNISGSGGREKIGGKVDPKPAHGSEEYDNLPK
jgi:hypothetical protein